MFNSTFQFVAPHFRSGIRLDLMDENTGLKVGTSYISIYSLCMRDADFNQSDWKSAGEDKYLLRDSDFSDKDPIGYVLAKLQFQEDTVGLFTSPNPHLAPTGPEEELSVERLRTHIARFKAIIAWVEQMYCDYCSIMNWDEPLLTFILFVIFLYMIFHVNSEYALSCPIFILVALMTCSWHRRRTGVYRQKWIEKNYTVPKLLTQNGHRPIAYLRLSVLDYRGFTPSMALISGLPLDNSSKKFIRPAYIKISYFPHIFNVKDETLPNTHTSSTKDLPIDGDSLLDEKVRDTIRL